MDRFNSKQYQSFASNYQNTYIRRETNLNKYKEYIDRNKVSTDYN